MVGHLGKYQRMNLGFTRPKRFWPWSIRRKSSHRVNLLTNALDSLEDGGTVWIECAAATTCEMVVADNGCGWSPTC